MAFVVQVRDVSWRSDRLRSSNVLHDGNIRGFHDFFTVRLAKSIMILGAVVW